MTDSAINKTYSVNHKRWVLVATFLFSIGLIFGIAAPSSVRSFFSGDVAYLGEIADLYPPFSFGTAIFILSKNVLAIFLSFILSPFLCLAPVMALVVNGWFIGFVLSTAVQEKSLFFALAGLLPHGILEIAAFILGEAAALSFGVMALMALTIKEMRSKLFLNLKRNLYFIEVAFALLVPAAIIETYVTPLLLR